MDASQDIIHEISELKKNGQSNYQIVQSLQRQGFKSAQIFDAMNMADLKSAGPQEMPPEYPEPMPQAYPETQNDYAAPQVQYEAPNNEQIEELVEAIIEEKWAELVKSVNKIITWKNTVDTRIALLDQKAEDLKKQFEVLHKGVLEKVSDYDSNIQNVGTEIKAMEQVFQKVLPTFTDNVNEISRIAKSLRDVSQSTPKRG